MAAPALLVGDELQLWNERLEVELAELYWPDLNPQRVGFVEVLGALEDSVRCLNADDLSASPKLI